MSLHVYSQSLSQGKNANWLGSWMEVQNPLSGSAYSLRIVFTEDLTVPSGKCLRRYVFRPLFGGLP